MHASVCRCVYTLICKRYRHIVYVHVNVCVKYLLLSCILATKPVRGICGVSWTMGGGGGGATDTRVATPRREAEGAAEKQRATEVMHREKERIRKEQKTS